MFITLVAIKVIPLFKVIQQKVDKVNLVLREKPDAKLLIVGKPTFDDYFKDLKKLVKKKSENKPSLFREGFFIS